MGWIIALIMDRVVRQVQIRDGRGVVLLGKREPTRSGAKVNSGEAEVVHFPEAPAVQRPDSLANRAKPWMGSVAKNDEVIDMDEDIADELARIWLPFWDDQELDACIPKNGYRMDFAALHFPLDIFIELPRCVCNAIDGLKEARQIFWHTA